MTCSRVHFPQSLQIVSSNRRSRRAISTYSPVPFAGIISRSSRIMPPTPILLHLLRPDFGCRCTQATNRGANHCCMTRSPRFFRETMRSNSTVLQHNHHYLLNVTFTSTSMHVPPRNITSIFAAASRQSARVVLPAAFQARHPRSCADGQTSSLPSRAKQSSGLAAWRLGSSLHRWA